MMASGVDKTGGKGGGVEAGAGRGVIYSVAPALLHSLA